ncbi:MAG: DUF1501 domain-containing protein [Planctomycetes bacterium]|nr:DUF1501 domain-containing protein [Planctomycetota bacterium]
MNSDRSIPSGPAAIARRNFFQQVGGGIFATALASVLSDDLYADVAAGRKPASRSASHGNDLTPRIPHFAPRARSVIQLFMNGGPSQMDLFDPKPELSKRHGQRYFDKIAGEVENPAEAGTLMRSPFRFARHGECGMWVSEIMPHLSKRVDDITLIRSMHTVNITHEPSIYMIQSGRMLPGLPTMGAWITYGLGSVNQNLPAYVVFDDPQGLPVNGTQNWQAGFLPPICQGTRFRSTGSPVLNLKREFDEPNAVTRLEDDLRASLDRLHRSNRPRQPRLGARIASYELAARMQLKATDALDLSQETRGTLALYGIDAKTTESYGRRCLMARRLIERGVRFVQLFINGQIWDNHSKIATSLKTACDRTDKPIAGLLLDLKQRGLLDETLVLWGGEFGRLPLSQMQRGNEKNAGRDHNKRAMCAWMAGGGVKAGLTYGETDELGFAAVGNTVRVNDWHATILHLLGMDHEQVVFHRNGLDEKLTGVTGANVVKGILA